MRCDAVRRRRCARRRVGQCFCKPGRAAAQPGGRGAGAAGAAGADSIMIEVHPNPPGARSDGPQQLTPAQFEVLVAKLREIAAVFGKKIV